MCEYPVDRALSHEFEDRRHTTGLALGEIRWLTARATPRHSYAVADTSLADAADTRTPPGHVPAHDPAPQPARPGAATAMARLASTSSRRRPPRTPRTDARRPASPKPLAGRTRRTGMRFSGSPGASSASAQVDPACPPGSPPRGRITAG